MVIAERYHDISAGHRVAGHESKCAHLHGHNYRFHFTITADNLDELGRVLDFGDIKTYLCEWLENKWYHKFLIWRNDPLMPKLLNLVPDDIVVTDFNPTAENMAIHMVNDIAPVQLAGTGCKLIKCKIEETRKCSAIYEITN